MHATLKTEIDSLPGALLLTDASSCILYANAAALSRTEYSLAEAVGKRPGELWGGRMEKGFYRRMWRRIATEKKPFAGTVSNHSKKRRTYDEHLFLVPLRDTYGAVRYYVQIRPQFGEGRNERLFREAFDRAERELARTADALPWLLERLDGRSSQVTRAVRAERDTFSWIRKHLVLPTEALFFRRQEDAVLIRAAQADPEAFAALYDRYRGELEDYFSIRLNRNADLAADLAQEVFVRCFRALPSFRITNASYRTYLLRAAHNVLINHYRQAARTEIPLSSAGAERLAAVQPMPEELVYGLFGKLNESERRIMVLKYEQGFKAREIAEREGKSENAVKLVLSRARKKLRN